MGPEGVVVDLERGQLLSLQPLSELETISQLGLSSIRKRTRLELLFVIN